MDSATAPFLAQATNAEDIEAPMGGGLDVTKEFSQMKIEDGQDGDVLVEATFKHPQMVKLATAEGHITTEEAMNDSEVSESNADAETAAVVKIEVVLENDIDSYDDVTSDDDVSYYTDSSSDDEPFDWPVIGDENFTGIEDETV